MIKFGNTYCGLLDPHDISRGWMKKFIDNDTRQPIAPPQSQVTQRGNNLLYLNYPPLPKPMVNRFVIPSGATRWSYGLLYVTREQLAEIYTDLAGHAGILELSSEHQFEQTYLPVKMTMWALPALPLQAGIVNENRLVPEPNNIGQDGFLLPVVDGRYWWQFLNVGLMSEEAIADADELLTYLLGLVPEDVTTKTLHTDYDLLPDVITANDYESLADVLETVTTQLGLTVVPDMTATSHLTHNSGSKFALLSTSKSEIIHADNFSGYGTLDGAAAATPEQFGVPLSIAGDTIGDYSPVMLPASVRVQNGGSWKTVTAATAGWTGNTVADTEVVLRYSWSGTVSDTLAERIATDYYGRYAEMYDQTIIGMQKMQPTSFTDCFIYDIISRKGEMQERLRMRSIPFNLYPQESSAAANEIGGFAVVRPFEICDGIGFACDCVQTTVITAACGSDVSPGDTIDVWDLCRIWLNMPEALLWQATLYAQKVKIHEDEYNRPPGLTGNCRWIVTGICCIEGDEYGY